MIAEIIKRRTWRGRHSRTIKIEVCFPKRDHILHCKIVESYGTTIAFEKSDIPLFSGSEIRNALILIREFLVTMDRSWEYAVLTNPQMDFTQAQCLAIRQLIGIFTDEWTNQDFFIPTTPELRELVL